MSHGSIVWWSGNYKFIRKTSSTLTGLDCRLTEGVPRFRVKIYLSFLTLCTRRFGGYTLPGGLGSDADQQRVRNWSSTTPKIRHAVGIKFLRSRGIRHAIGMSLVDKILNKV